MAEAVTGVAVIADADAVTAHDSSVISSPSVGFVPYSTPASPGAMAGASVEDDWDLPAHSSLPVAVVYGASSPTAITEGDSTFFGAVAASPATSLPTPPTSVSGGGAAPDQALAAS